MCGGHRTLRHNSIRNAVFSESREACLRCEKEKIGLLPPRPEDERLKGECLSNGRRPADIWLADWCDGSAGAVDFAVTSGLRSDLLQTSVMDGSTALALYDDYKRRYLDTETTCSANQLCFLPFIVEAHAGGLGKTARRVCGFIARAHAASQCKDVAEQASKLLRRISTSLHRENARAILCRLPLANAGSSHAHPAVWDYDSPFCWQ